MTQDEVDVLEMSRAVDRLHKSEDFQKVILEGFIYSQALSTGTSFEGSMDDVDTLKAVSLLNRWLQDKIEQGKIILNQGKGA